MAGSGESLLCCFKNPLRNVRQLSKRHARPVHPKADGFLGISTPHLPSAVPMTGHRQAFQTCPRPLSRPIRHSPSVAMILVCPVLGSRPQIDVHLKALPWSIFRVPKMVSRQAPLRDVTSYCNKGVVMGPCRLPYKTRAPLLCTSGEQCRPDLCAFTPQKHNANMTTNHGALTYNQAMQPADLGDQQ